MAEPGFGAGYWSGHPDAADAEGRARAAADIQHPHARRDPGQPEQVHALRSEHTGLELRPLGFRRAVAQHVPIVHGAILAVACRSPVEGEQLDRCGNLVKIAGYRTRAATERVIGR